MKLLTIVMWLTLVSFGSVTKSMSLPSSTEAPSGQFSKLCAFIPSCVSSRLCQSSMPLLTDYDDQPDIAIPIEEQPSLNPSNYPEVSIRSCCFKLRTRHCIVTNDFKIGIENAKSFITMAFCPHFQQGINI